MLRSSVDRDVQSLASDLDPDYFAFSGLSGGLISFRLYWPTTRDQIVARIWVRDG